LAHEAREQLARGLDPIDERDKVRAAAQQAEAEKKADRERERWTLARWARAYHERVIEPKATDKHGAQWIASLENHVPARIWQKPIDAIEPPELLQALREIRPHERARRHDGDSVPETVQRIRQRLEAVFEDAIFHKRCTVNPAAAIKRKMREEQPRRDRGQFAALPYREAPALVADLRRQEGIAARCLEFAVLTTSRTSEALLAEWSEFDLAAGLWTIPAAKMKAKEAEGGACRLPLASRAGDRAGPARTRSGLPVPVTPDSRHRGEQTTVEHGNAHGARPHGSARPNDRTRAVPCDLQHVGQRDRYGAARRHRGVPGARGRRQGPRGLQPGKIRRRASRASVGLGSLSRAACRGGFATTCRLDRRAKHGGRHHGAAPSPPHSICETR
jgi:integrase